MQSHPHKPPGPSPLLSSLSLSSLSLFSLSLSLSRSLSLSLSLFSLSSKEGDHRRSPPSTVLAGQSLGGLGVGDPHAGLHASHRFGLILSHIRVVLVARRLLRVSSSGDALIDEYAAAPRVPSCASSRRRVETSARFSDQNRAGTTSCESVGMRLVDPEFQGGHDYACWRGGLADGLIELLEPPCDEPAQGRRSPVVETRSVDRRCARCDETGARAAYKVHSHAMTLERTRLHRAPP